MTKEYPLERRAMINKEPEIEEFDLRARDIPNFNPPPRLEKLEETVGTLMEEMILVKGRLEYFEGYCLALSGRLERLEKELNVG